MNRYKKNFLMPTYLPLAVNLHVPIGGVSPIGSVRIAEDCFVADWVVRGAPFTCCESNMSSRWHINDRDGVNINLDLSETEAKAAVEKYNELAALAIMMKGADQ